MKQYVIFPAMFLSLLNSLASADDNWPQFRGPEGSGIGSGTPPVAWDIESGHNVLWKLPVPGLGHSAPIVWGNRIILTTAVNADAENPEVTIGWSGGSGESANDTGEWTWQVLCIDRTTGKILWTRDAKVGQPANKRHLKASHANCTPATNGTHVVAFFGSEGLHCYDFQGEKLWAFDFGKLSSGPYDAPQMEWGFASSPIIHDDRVIVQCDCLNTNFVAILDIKTGKEIQRISRDGEVAGWSTPLVVTTAKQKQIVCNGFHQMAGYDWTSGTRLWHLSGGGDLPVPAPLYANGLIYLTNGHGRSPTYAIKPNATGDLTPTDEELEDDKSDAGKSDSGKSDSGKSDSGKSTIESPATVGAANTAPLATGLVWWQPRDGSYMPTPLVKDGLLYTCNDNGRLAVRDALTGELIYRKRIGTGNRTYSASAVAAGGHLYFVSERGEVNVIAEGREYAPVASLEMEEVVMATPAISGNRLLIRTLRELVCLGEQ